MGRFYQATAEDFSIPTQIDVADLLTTVGIVALYLDDRQLFGMLTPPSWSYTQELTLPVTPMSAPPWRVSHSLRIDASDRVDNSTSRSVTLVEVDDRPPFFEIQKPYATHSIPSTSAGAQVELEVLAEDLQSGVASVEYSFDGVSYMNVSQIAKNMWGTTITMRSPGRAQIFVRATDRAGNTSVQSRHFEIAAPYLPFSLNDLSPRAYLEDLLWFAGIQINTTPNQATPNWLTSEDLAQVFHQPFQQLTLSTTQGTSASVNQLRIAIEVLRRYLRPPDTGLAAHWRFDEGNGTTTTDVTAQTAPAVIDGPTWGAGRWANGLAFDGVDDVVHVRPDEQLRAITNSFTIMFWAYPLAEHTIDPQSSSGVALTSGKLLVIGPQHGDAAYGLATTRASGSRSERME